MSLRIPGKWIWDFWFALDGPDYHMFYLQAARSLEDELLRHWHVSVGHAVSQDLINWRVLADALCPAPAEQDVWDNYTPWTGSIIRFFCVNHPHYSQARAARPGMQMVTGTHYFIGATPLGPFHLATDEFLLADTFESRYAGKAIQDPQGN